MRKINNNSKSKLRSSTIRNAYRSIYCGDQYLI